MTPLCFDVIPESMTGRVDRRATTIECAPVGGWFKWRRNRSRSSRSRSLQPGVRALACNRGPAEWRRWGWAAAVAIVVTGLGVGGAFFMASGKEHPGARGGGDHAAGHAGSGSRSQRSRSSTRARGNGTNHEPARHHPRVRVRRLYTKVSGFVKKLNVDRGSLVKKGEVLAEIYDPGAGRGRRAGRGRPGACEGRRSRRPRPPS